jgi:hypothetical protein
MNDSALHVILLLAGTLFSSGGFYVYVKMTLKHVEEKVNKNFHTLDVKIEANNGTCMRDLAGIGAKVARVERESLRRYHNTTMAVMLIADLKDEEKITNLMREPE